MERGTNRPRGFGFVTMGTRAAAEEAISRMDQAQLDGRTIRVNESRPRGEGPPGRGSDNGQPNLGPGGRGTFNPEGKPEVKLYVGNLAFDTTEDSVRKIFEPYGPIVDCFLPQDRDSAKPRGFAFVTMGSSDAEQACLKVNGMEVDGRALRVNEAQPKGSAPPRGGYGGGGGGYEDRGGYGGGGGYGRGGYGGGYGGRGGGGYEDRYGGPPAYDDRGGYGGYQRGGYGGGYGGGRGGGYAATGYDDRAAPYGGGGYGGYAGGGGYSHPYEDRHGGGHGGGGYERY